MSKILVLSPHTDDAEISCGGTIAKMKKLGNELLCLSFSYANISIPEDFPKISTFLEYEKSMNLFGIEHLSFDYPTRYFPDHKQNILELLIKFKERFKPDIVLLPNSCDVHQDHQVIHQEGLRAFRNCSIFGYENIWNTIGKPNMSTYIPLTNEHIGKKMEVIECYRSQIHKKPDLIDVVLSLAQVRGSEIGAKYAETFETIRSII